MVIGSRIDRNSQQLVSLAKGRIKGFDNDLFMIRCLDLIRAKVSALVGAAEIPAGITLGHKYQLRDASSEWYLVKPICLRALRPSSCNERGAIGSEAHSFEVDRRRGG